MGKNYAVFVDLENCGGKTETLTDVIEKVKLRGDILLGKVYGYDEKYSGLKELLLSNTFYVVPSLRWGYNQKNNLDIQLVIDALEVAYKNELIDCFCIVSGDSDYTPLVGKLKSMGKFVLGISRSEVASKVFINACNEFIFLETVSDPVNKRGKRRSEESAPSTPEALNQLVERIVRSSAGADGYLYVSELKNTLTRLHPDFNEKNYGYNSFGKLVGMLEKKFGTLSVKDDNNVLKICISNELSSPAEGRSITKANWKQIFKEKLLQFKEDGFDRVNPSIVKTAIQSDFPGFDEHQIGFNRFLEVMRELESDQVIKIQSDENHSVLLKIL